jgi:hypothetical protein
MANDTPPPAALNLVDSAFAPETPAATIAGDKLSWNAIPGATGYLIIHDGKIEKRTSELAEVVQSSEKYSEYQVSAVNAAGWDLSAVNRPVLAESKLRWRRKSRQSHRLRS